MSHSGTYRERYRPAYRVVLARFGALVPILAAIDREMAGGSMCAWPSTGPCASGKSTLAETLADIYRCPVVHMDDFFLQPHQRTPERLAQPGGNVDYERFDAQVLPPCTGTKPPAIAPGGAAPATWGRRSPSAPTCGSAITCGSGTEAPWDVRLARIAQRGPGCTARFQQIWIPLEDRYFAACQVKECCQLVWSGDK